MSKALADCRVLVVEDEMLVLMTIEDMLADLGCTSVTAAATVNQALALVGSGGFDLATLDLNLNGDRSFAVADALAAAGVPFAFSTGYSGQCAGSAHAERPILRKPYMMQQFSDTIDRLLE